MVDGTSISLNHLAYRWTVEVKREESIKEEGKNKRRGGKKERQEILYQSTIKFVT